MSRIMIKRPVILTYVVTERFKAQMTEELDEAAQRVELQIQQLDFQGKRYIQEVQKTDLRRAMDARQQIEAELAKHQALKNEIEEQKKRISEMELGSRYSRGTLESQVEVGVGDNLEEVLRGAELVVQDGVILEAHDHA